MKFVPPVLFLLFGIALVGLWGLERKLRFARILAAGFCVLALAMFSHFGGIPPEVRQNAVVSGFLYVASMVLIGDGMLQRSGKRFPAWLALLYLTGITGALWYYAYIDRDLIARIYVLNFGMGAILLHAAWRARFLIRGSWTDRALLLLLLLSGLHFFPRTLLTIGSVSMPTTPQQFGQTEFWHMVVLSTSLLGAMGGLCLLGIIVVDIVSKLRQERDLDPLTGVLNRRGLERSIRRLEAVERGLIRVVAACDLDRFKAINDTYGHYAGDAVLSTFAEIIRRNVRKGDIVARTGGEEFVLVLDHISEEEAFAFSERVRRAVETGRFPGVSAMEPVTCSFGLARALPGEPFWTTVRRADKALYQAKRSGRNQTRAEWQADNHADARA